MEEESFPSKNLPNIPSVPQKICSYGFNENARPSLLGMVLSAIVLSIFLFFWTSGAFVSHHCSKFLRKQWLNNENLGGFMKKKATQPKEGQYKNELIIIEPMKVRLSKKGNTVMVFLNQKTVMMFSKKFLDAVISRKYQKRGA